MLFVGRITRQKGIAHLLRAAQEFDDSVPLVLCAASPDTPELGAEVSAAIDTLREQRPDVHWLNGHLDRSGRAAAAQPCPGLRARASTSRWGS